MSLRTLALLAATVASAQTNEFFETRVRPVLARQCYSCHGPDKQFNGLRVDSRQALLDGGKRGPAIAAGEPASSLLVKALRHQGLAMPPGGRVSERDIAAIEEWIRAGAAWPASAKPAAATPAWYDDAARTHWSFQPVRRVAPPSVRDTSWPAGPIDRFLLAGLEAKGLRPAPPASPLTLIRRASLVLTGLPPTQAAIDEFTSDRAPGAFGRAVDRLIGSPHFGEHWARHWLDVARYAETRGYEWNYEIVGAWRYRDYLIRAFNEDLPYDWFVREHIAGDLNGRSPDAAAATAFHRLGEAGHDDCVKFREISLDVVDNQIDTLSKAFQGVTLGCARCHDHKLDPIPTADYYGLFGILNGSRAATHTLDPGPPGTAEQRIRALKPAIRAELARIWKSAPWTLPTRGRGRIALDHPLLPWLAMRDTPDFASVWERLRRTYARERAEREAFNRANFTEIAGFAAGSGGWSAGGLGLRDGPNPPGEFAVAPEGEAAISGILPAGLHTHAVSNLWNGALRSPLLPKDRKYVSLRLSGGRLSARRTVLDNCAIGEGYQPIESPSPAWTRLSTLSNEKLPVFLEVITKHDNPRIPDRPGVLKVSAAEIASPRSWFGAERAVAHDTPESPREELAHMDRLFHEPIATDAGLAARYRAVALAAIEAWERGSATNDDVRWLDGLLAAGVLPNSAAASPRLGELIAAYRAAEKDLPRPRVVDGIGDAGPAPDAAILRGGNPQSPGPVAPRHFLSRIGPAWPGAPASGSGRLELAGWIASPSNPLTARVMVNRVWSHVFGRGLAATVDNLGREGEPPTHPELLDYLAAGFMEDGWSVKRLVKRIVTTAAFQQSSAAAKEALAGDPRNQLIHHWTPRRMPAESVRDSILAASGRLDLSMHGPSIPPHRDQPKDYRRLFAGPLDGSGRRAIYTQITRMEGPRFLEIFDYPPPLSARGARDVTNVPAQALALLNDPFVIDQAGVWARRLIDTGPADPGARVDAMFREALGRPASVVERDRFTGLAAELASLHGVPRAEAAANLAVWKDVAHAVYNLKEFVYIP